MKLDELAEDYTRHRVPASRTVSGLRIAVIVIGIAITLPAFLVGAQFGQQLGFTGSLIAFALAGAIVAAIGSLTGIVGAQTRLSTYMLIIFAFGRKGAVLINCVLLLTAFGWFGVTAALFAEASDGVLTQVAGIELPEPVHLLFGSTLMIGATVFGFKSLDKLSMITVPLMLLFLLSALSLTLGDTTWDQLLITAPAPDVSIGFVASAIAGAFMAGATLMPDLCRYARSPAHAISASILAYAVGYPLVLGIGALPALASGESEIMAVILGLGLGLSGFALLVAASVTTNAANLYSSALVIAALTSRFPLWQLVVLSGGLGTLLAALGIMVHFTDFLIWLGVVIPPIGGVIVVDFFCRRSSYHADLSDDYTAISYAAMIAWAAASTLGFVTVNELITLTTIPAVDSILMATLVHLVLLKLTPPRSPQPEAQD